MQCFLLLPLNRYFIVNLSSSFFYIAFLVPPHECFLVCLCSMVKFCFSCHIFIVVSDALEGSGPVTPDEGQKMLCCLKIFLICYH